ncbi:MAG: PilZ domain-containing protein [Polyangiales bacterium]
MHHFRAWPRVASRASVVMRIGSGTVRGRLIDLGLGGAGILLEGSVAEGAEVEIVIAAPNRWDPLVVPARVAWARGKRAGVAFKPRDDRDAYALFEFLGTQSFE